jgi:predicted NAD/FAD-dependent oxidoreductase
VDASCVLPMPSTRTAMTRAFQFRRRYGEELQRRAALPWPDPAGWPEPFTADPGFEPFDLGSPLDEAISRCRIDHSLPPVADTPGGSRAAYRRWSGFLASGLDGYHRQRNDAARPQAVSRMSPYLHYGCASPFRIAREAIQRGGEGAEKFLDELLVWRELSHHFCHHAEVLEDLDALPDWARETLLRHEFDPRERTFDWERLLRGRTGEPLWDLAQRSLLRQGELHNNVRMSWGKSMLRWTARPERALKLMIDLNHRCALDGSDPNSYGGLLWCLGQFDRPFPGGPIFGRVRQRSLARHAARLDMDAYARLVSAPASGKHLRVAVVGAGLSGLMAARILCDQGHEVVVVEKARGAGGRMSTRRDGDYRFDHGAQYFTARDPRFLRHVLAWQERGLVQRWEARIEALGGSRPGGGATRRYLAVPGMNAICREIASELPDCRYQWQVSAVSQDEDGWLIESAEGERIEAEALLLTAPPEQCRALLPRPRHRQALDGLEMMPCWAVMAVFDRPLSHDWDAAFVNDDGPLSWVASQAARPGRPPAHAWVLHAGPEWSREHLECEPDEIRQRLLDAAWRLPGAEPAALQHASCHRWRYALARQPLEVGCLWFGEDRLALAGDWCSGSRVEGAFLSGVAAAGRILSSARPERD